MRNLLDVIEQIKEQIPDGNESFIAALEDNKSSVRFSAPEMMGMWWNEVAETLYNFFPEKETEFEEWHHKVINIWMDKKTLSADLSDYV